MNIKEGDIFKKSLDGVNFAVKKIVNGIAVLESKDRKRQILTEVNVLELKSFYIFQLYPPAQKTTGYACGNGIEEKANQ